MFPARSFPLREELDVMARIRLTAAQAKRIWQRSFLAAGGLWGTLETIGKHEDKLRRMIAQGKLTMDSFIEAPWA
jgi:hypothetical protein